MIESRKDIALLVAERYLGSPYIWGGDDPLAGFDCSGFAQECLASGDACRAAPKLNAEMLRELFAANKRQGAPERGDLAFRLRADGTAKHVEIVLAVIGGDVFTIGASGGDDDNLTVEKAVEENAYVQIGKKGNWHLFLNPWRKLA